MNGLARECKAVFYSKFFFHNKEMITQKKGK